eukprot:3108035-Lingulodinium_polyedra.AAC.1
MGETQGLVAVNYNMNHSSLGNLWRKWISLDRRGGARSRWYQTHSVTSSIGNNDSTAYPIEARERQKVAEKAAKLAGVE